MACPEMLWMLVPVVLSPDCQKSHWLVEEQMYSLGSCPKRFKGQSPVNFLCCDKRQYVLADRVRYEPVYINPEI
jgi:hypothetical protein